MPHVRPNIRTANTDFATLRTRGLAGLIDLVVTANSALANPSTQATVNVTGGGSSGGTLAAGAYFLAYTFANGVGETTVGTGRSNTFTVAAGNIPRVTVPSLPTGASHINIYLTAVGGASGSEVLYYTGLTTTTYDLSVNTFDNALVPIPTANTTALSNIPMRTAYLQRNGTDAIANRFESLLSQFLSGRPVAFDEARKSLLRDRAAIETLGRAMDDALTLLDANRGTLTTEVSGAGVRNPVRTFS